MSSRKGQSWKTQRFQWLVKVYQWTSTLPEANHTLSQESGQFFRDCWSLKACEVQCSVLAGSYYCPSLGDETGNEAVDAGGHHGMETGAHQTTCQRPKPATEKSVSEIINGTPKTEKEEEFLATAFLQIWMCSSLFIHLLSIFGRLCQLLQEPTSASASPTSPLRPPSPASPTSPTTPRSPSRVKCSPELPVISVEVWMWNFSIRWLYHHHLDWPCNLFTCMLFGPLVFTSQEFRRTLKRLYGSVHAGWVKYLDVTEVACSVMKSVPINYQAAFCWRQEFSEWTKNHPKPRKQHTTR